MATERMGRKKLLSKAGWVEVSVAPHGKRAAIPAWQIEGIMESNVEGVGATIVYRAGQSVSNVPVLDLYLPLLHTVLDKAAEESDQPVLWSISDTGDTDAPPSNEVFTYPDNGDDIKAPQNT